jgi:hypothetical protein
MMGISNCCRRSIHSPVLLLAMACLAAPVSTEDSLPLNGQPASDILMSYDLWGNPTPIGGVTNGGTTSHSTW